MISPNEMIDKFNQAMQECRTYFSNNEKGKVRALKGSIVEETAKNILLLAISKKGLNHSKVKFSTQKIPIAIQEDYLNNLPDYAKEHLNSVVRKTYGLKVDVHAFYKQDFLCVIACKAYTENAMLKRILFDFYLVNRYSPRTKTILFQVENWMGGKDFDTEREKYNATTHALISNMPTVQFHLITLTPRTRDIHKPIEFSGFVLEKEHIDQAVNKFVSILDN